MTRTKIVHIRCPHCRNPIEIANENEFSEIPCPSCGSSFSLLNDETQTYVSKTQQIGHFELIEQLGVGAFGAVWKARDTELDRIVAVKIPRKGQLDPEESEQFLREARAAAQVKHPNIVPVHEVGRQDGSVYIVSDFVEGATLSDWTAEKRLTIRETVELCCRLADALHQAHEAGVVHRDLKPSNIMMSLDGEPHIMDFGLAKREAGEITMTVEGRVIGTPAYMSPEQARGEGHNADRRSDIYSLGVILFQLLTGELPFRGNARMLIVQILKDDPPALRKLNSAIPRDVETLCAKCLEKEPSKRYATAEELSDDLSRWLRNEPIHARPIGALEKSVRWIRRRPAAAGLVATMGIAVVTAVGLCTALAYQGSLNRAYSAESNAREKAEEALDLAGRVSYAHSISLANEAILANDVKLALQRLGEVPPALRRWEWHFLAAQCRTAEFSVPIQGIRAAFVRNGDQIITMTEEGLTFFDSKDGRKTRVVNDTKGAGSIVFVDKLGRRIGLYKDQKVHVFDAETAVQTCSFFSSGPMGGSAKFSADGAVAAYRDTESRWNVINLANGEVLMKADGGNAELSENGEVITTYETGSAPTVYQARKGTKLSSLTYDTSAKYVGTPALSHDGKLLAMFHDDFAQATVFSTSDGESAFSFPVLTAEQRRGGLQNHTSNARVTFSPASRFVGASIYRGNSSSGVGNGVVRVSDTASGKQVLAIDGFSSGPLLAFSQDDSRVAVTDRHASAIRVFDTASGSLVMVVQKQGEIRGLSFTSNGDQLILAFERAILIKDLNTGEDVRVIRNPGAIVRFALTPDEQLLAVHGFDKVVRIYNLAEVRTNTTVQRFEGRPAALSGDMSQLVLGQNSGGLRVVDAKTGKVVHEIGEASQGFTNSVVVSNDGALFAAGGGETRVYRVSDDKLAHRLTREARPVAFDAQGDLATVSGSRSTSKIVIHRLSGEGTTELDGEGLMSPAFSSDGERIAVQQISTTEIKKGNSTTITSMKSAVAIFDATSGKRLVQLQSDDPFMFSPRFSPDGQTVAVLSSQDRTYAGYGGYLQLFDAATGKRKSSTEGSSLMSFSFTPDGERIVAVGLPDGVLHILDGKSSGEILTIRQRVNPIGAQIAFSRDGRRIGVLTNSLRAVSGQELRIYAAPGLSLK